MKILITGHLGFIFGHLTEYLLNNYDYEIIGYDAFTYAANRELDFELSNKYFDRLTCYCGDRYRIEDLKTLGEIVEKHKPDLIINGAAETHNDNAIANSFPFITTNINGVHSILEVCKAFKIPLIHMSTDEVLDHKIPINNDGVGREPAFEGLPFDYKRECYLENFYEYENSKNLWFARLKEDAKLNPRNPYSASKAAGELLINSYIETHGVDAKIIRCTNVYGPRQNKEKFLAKAITEILTGGTFPVYGKGEQWRDWLYVKDFCTAFDLIMHKGTKRIYHIAANDERQNKDTGNLVCKLMGCDGYYFVKDRSGHDFSYSLNCDKLKALGWKKQYTFEQGLKETIESYKGD